MPQLFLQFVFIHDILSPYLHCFSKAQIGHFASVSLQSLAGKQILFSLKSPSSKRQIKIDTGNRQVNLIVVSCNLVLFVKCTRAC